MEGGEEGGGRAGGEEDVEGDRGAEDAGEGYGLDASADDGRGIPVKRGRGPGGFREVEGDHVEEREEDLVVWWSARAMPRMPRKGSRWKANAWWAGISRSGAIFPPRDRSEVELVASNDDGIVS